MKTSILALSLLLSASAFAEVEFSGPGAMKIFLSLTGPRVVQDGAAGRTYRVGEGIACSGSNTPSEKEDPTSYSCTLRFTRNGKILPPNQ